MSDDVTRWLVATGLILAVVVLLILAAWFFERVVGP
jgi:hypothetical protein